MSKEVTYNSNLLKGTGLIQEMLILIDTYESGESPLEFQKRVLEEGLLSKSTDTRTKDIVGNIFKDRFLEQSIDVPKVIKSMREEYVSMDVVTQLFLIYTCRANPILGDFIRDVYYSKIKKGQVEMNTDDPKEFIQEAIGDGRIPRKWANSTIQKVSEHINACLIDFKLIERNKTITLNPILDLTANYLAHELHFLGYSDNEILEHNDWKLFGIERAEIAQILERLSFRGTFLFQFSGELLKIGWKNKNFQEFIENECR